MSDPVEVLYFYRTSWGAHDEFVELFRKNHWPILREQLGDRPVHRGRDVHAALPRRRPGGLGRPRLDHVPRLGRDGGAQRRRDRRAGCTRTRRRSRREEQRRFELLEAHWDVPLEPARAAGTLRRPPAISPTRRRIPPIMGDARASQEVDPPPCRRSPS